MEEETSVEERQRKYDNPGEVVEEEDFFPPVPEGDEEEEWEDELAEGSDREVEEEQQTGVLLDQKEEAEEQSVGEGKGTSVQGDVAKEQDYGKELLMGDFLSGGFNKGYRKFEKKDIPFPSFHTDKHNLYSRFPSRWFEVEGVKPPKDHLKAPRIRKAPRKKRIMVQLQKETDYNFFLRMISCGCLSKTTREVEEEEVEGLQDIKVYNISYQDLGDPFQLYQLRKILRGLKSVEKLSLTNNNIGLESLRDITIPSLLELNMSRNEIQSLSELPAAPNLRKLVVSDNHISELSGLRRYKKLEDLVLIRNPICLEEDYVKQVKKKLPKLKYLDFEYV